MSSIELQAYIDEGRLIRGSWAETDKEGRETACLLAAISPEVRATESVSACPSTLMPRWLALLTPWIDDCGSAEAWPGMVRRYARLASRWHVLSAEQWRRLDFAARAASLREAASHTKIPSVVAACERVAALCELDDAWAAPSAEEAAREAAWAAREAARTAAEAAEAAAAAAAAAAWAAREAARAAAEAAAAAAAAAARESEAAADRITAAILDAIEAEIVKTEAQ